MARARPRGKRARRGHRRGACRGPTGRALHLATEPGALANELDALDRFIGAGGGGAEGALRAAAQVTVAAAAGTERSAEVREQALITLGAWASFVRMLPASPPARRSSPSGGPTARRSRRGRKTWISLASSRSWRGSWRPPSRSPCTRSRVSRSRRSCSTSSPGRTARPGGDRPPRRARGQCRRRSTRKATPIPISAKGMIQGLFAAIEERR